MYPIVEIFTMDRYIDRYRPKPEVTLKLGGGAGPSGARWRTAEIQDGGRGRAEVTRRETGSGLRTRTEDGPPGAKWRVAGGELSGVPHGRPGAYGPTGGRAGAASGH